MGNYSKIAFYSPVPGSGSSLMSWIYANYIAEHTTDPVCFISCDYRYSVFGDEDDSVTCLESPMTVFLPYIDKSKCNICKACAKACAFGAIRIHSAVSHIFLRAEKCRACGACLNTCRYNAISERERVIGIKKQYPPSGKITLLEGQLLAEDFFAIHLLQELLRAPGTIGSSVIDAPGGLNYHALESMHSSDAVVIIVDPSTFNVSYFTNVLKVIKKYHHNMLAVINFSDTGEDPSQFFHKKGIAVIKGLPDLGLLTENMYSRPLSPWFNNYEGVNRQIQETINLMKDPC